MVTEIREDTVHKYHKHNVIRGVIQAWIAQAGILDREASKGVLIPLVIFINDKCLTLHKALHH